MAKRLVLWGVVATAVLTATMAQAYGQSGQDLEVVPGLQAEDRSVLDSEALPGLQAEDRSVLDSEALLVAQAEEGSSAELGGSDNRVELVLALLVGVAVVALLGTFAYWTRTRPPRSSSAEPHDEGDSPEPSPWES